MKKTVKRIALAVTALFALIGGTGIVAFASGYITWNGTQDYHQTLDNLSLISGRGKELKTSNEELTTKNEELIINNDKLTTDNDKLSADKENINRELEQASNQLLDKDNQIDALEQEIVALKKTVEGGQTTQDQLGQAEKDMKDVKDKSEEVLNEFN